MFNIKTLKEEFGNYYIGYLLDNINKDFIILDDVSIPKFNDASFKIDIKLLKFRRNRIHSERIMFKGLLSRGIRRDLIQQENRLKERYEIIKKSGLPSENLLIINHIISLHKTSKLFIFKYLCYKHYFQNKLFKTITSVDENSPKIKSIFDAAKFQGIKTIGIQHGTIHELHPSYVFTKTDRERKIMPDYTMVWGIYWKTLLVNKGNYPEDSLVVTGQIRTDIIPLLKNSNKNNIPDIPNDKKIIVFASQPQRDEKLRKQAAFDVFSSVSKLPEVFLVIKLHPAEFNDFEYYRNIASEAECNNYTILYNIDLYKLISISKIIITCFSTVGAEAVYFHKPLVILDHLKQDIQNYKKEGIAFQATDKRTLTEVITDILSGNLTIDNKAYTDYISEYAYKIDGKVTQRIINFISAI
jgi:CDP-glycerol glycerophosphotransferase (TagB/SpsB family)